MLDLGSLRGEGFDKVLFCRPFRDAPVDVLLAQPQLILHKLQHHKRVTRIRTRGGNMKQRALRLDTGNFSWPTEASTQRARILDVVYNATSNELVRTKTLVKNCIVSVDAAPFKNFFAKQYHQFGIDIGAAFALVFIGPVQANKLSDDDQNKLKSMIDS